MFNVYTPKVEKLLSVFNDTNNRKELHEMLGLADRKNFRMNYLNPAIAEGVVDMIGPDKPNSSNHQYILTVKTRQIKER